MRVLGFFLFAIAFTLLLGGCALQQSASFDKQIAFQLGDVSEVLILPIQDHGESLDVGSPRIVSAPFHTLTAQLQEDCFDRLLLLTSDGTLYSVIIGESASGRLPSPVIFYRKRLDTALKSQLLAMWSEMEAETDLGDSISVWTVPCAEASAEVTLLADESAWKRAVRFLEKIEVAEDTEAESFRFHDRYSGMHGVFCPAQSSHIKPNYSPRSILMLEYGSDKSVRIENNATFVNTEELEKALNIHLASGRYALLKLKLVNHMDIFTLDRSGIGDLLRERAEYYGSDFVIVMPDHATIWYCSRCFSPE